MTNALATINRVASWIPSKVRGVIYALIGLAMLLEEIWHFLPDGDLGVKVQSTIKLLTLLMAVVNTDLVPDPRPPVLTDEQLEAARVANDRGESTLVTILVVLAIIVLVAFLFGWIRP